MSDKKLTAIGRVLIFSDGSAEVFNVEPIDDRDYSIALPRVQVNDEYKSELGKQIKLKIVLLVLLVLSLAVVLASVYPFANKSPAIDEMVSGDVNVKPPSSAEMQADTIELVREILAEQGISVKKQDLSCFSSIGE